MLRIYNNIHWIEEKRRRNSNPLKTVTQQCESHFGDRIVLLASSDYTPRLNLEDIH